MFIKGILLYIIFEGLFLQINCSLKSKYCGDDNCYNLLKVNK